MKDEIFEALCESGIKKLGLMGGTFDPVHAAHVRMARSAKEQFGLDAVLFLVSKDPPHKSASASQEHRYNMLKLALMDEPGLYPSCIELEREGKTYTVDTLEYIKSRMPQTELYYIVGVDTLYDLKHGWRNIERVCELTSFLAFGRLEPTRETGELPAGCRVLWGQIEESALSSTSIRKRVTQGLPIKGMVDDRVLEYIAEKGLYQKECMTFEEARDAVYGMIPEKRYIHTMLVVQTAKLLAEKNGVDNNKAAWAGLLHDCAKALAPDESLAMLSSLDCPVDEITLRERSLLHAPLGAALAKSVFGIDDQEILDAIACHTTGKANMTTLDKIIYLADAIEPSRDYPQVEELRKQAMEDLDGAVLAYMDVSIKYILKKGGLLHPNTVDGRNHLVIQLSQRENQSQ